MISVSAKRVADESRVTEHTKFCWKNEARRSNFIEYAPKTYSP